MKKIQKSCTQKSFYHLLKEMEALHACFKVFNWVNQKTFGTKESTEPQG